MRDLLGRFPATPQRRSRLEWYHPAAQNVLFFDPGDDGCDRVYPHELAEEAPGGRLYDGLLASAVLRSRITADGTLAKRPFEGRGHWNLPSGMALVGDCGAFSTHQTGLEFGEGDVADWYDLIDVDWGVAPDVIIGEFTPVNSTFEHDWSMGTLSQREAWAETYENAIRWHSRYEDRRWLVSASAQGWTPATKAEMARRYVLEGVKHVSIGGIFNLKPRALLELVATVAERADLTGVGVHLLGIAQPETWPWLEAAGVTSVDNTTSFAMAGFIHKAVHSVA